MRADEIVISGSVHSVRVGKAYRVRGWSRRQEAMTLPQLPWPAGASWLGVTPGPAAEPDSGKVSIRQAM
jgi:hypothetical protein